MRGMMADTKKITLLLVFLCNSFSFTMDESSPQDTADQIFSNYLKKLQASIEAEKTRRIQKEKAEEEFVILIEKPFAQSKEKTIKKLSDLLALGVNPHKERKSLNEKWEFKPINYLLSQSSQADPDQQSCIEQMIDMIYNAPYPQVEVSWLLSIPDW